MQIYAYICMLRIHIDQLFEERAQNPHLSQSSKDVFIDLWVDLKQEQLTTGNENQGSRW